MKTVPPKILALLIGVMIITAAWLDLPTMGQTGEPLQYHSEELHFSMTLPAGWHQVPDRQLREWLKYSEYNDKLKMAFMPGKNQYDLPVVIVGSTTNDSDLTFDDLKHNVQSKLEGSSLENDPRIHFDDTRKIAVIPTESDPKIAMLSLYCLGKGSSVLFIVMENKGHEAQLSKLVDSLEKSFQFDKGFENTGPSIVWRWLAWLPHAFHWLAGFSVLATAFFVGRWNEKKHYRSIQQREAAMVHMPAVTSTLKTIMAGETHDKIATADLVTGSVVLSADQFRTFLGNMISIVGGNLTPYQGMMDRARREAILRMKADALGADMIVNVRLQSHAIGSPHHDHKSKSAGKAIEVLAYGTAIKFKK